MTNNRITFLLLALLLWGNVSRAQNDIEQVMKSILQNNASLRTAQAEAEAQKVAERTDIFLEGPEMGYNRLWGSPLAIGNRTDFSVSQSFDLPTLTGQKSRLARLRQQLPDQALRAKKQEVLLEARQACVDLIYYNALIKLLAQRTSRAESLLAAYSKQLEQGNTNQIETGKARLYLAAARGEEARARAEQANLKRTLEQLNGGLPIELNDTLWPADPLPADFNAWMKQAGDNHPTIRFLHLQAQADRREVSLARALNLPRITTGYMSEKTAGEHYQGITLGLSLPLWQNKNRTRRAQAQMAATEQKQQEARLSLDRTLHAAYQQAVALHQVADDYRQALNELRNRDLLDRTLKSGEITLTDYLMEMNLYHETQLQILATQRDAEKAKAQLWVALQ